MTEHKTCTTCKNATVTREFYHEASGKLQWVHNYKFRFETGSPCLGCPDFLGKERGIHWRHHEYPSIEPMEVTQ